MQVNTRSWNWDKVDGSYWTKPAVDVYFLLHRWKELGYTAILDLGCGIGRHSLLLAEHGFSVTAADLSESGLRKLAEAAHRRNLKVETVLTDVQRLPFKDASFDCVLAFHAIYHVDREGMLRALFELRRVLKPKAEIYITLISKSASSYTDQESKIVDQNVRLKREEDGTELPHFYVDQADIGNLLSGYRIIALRQIEDVFDGRSNWHYFVHASVLEK